VNENNTVLTISEQLVAPQLRLFIF